MVKEKSIPYIDIQYQTKNNLGKIPIIVTHSNIEEPFSYNDGEIDKLKLSIKNKNQDYLEYAVYIKNKGWSPWLEDGTNLDLSTNVNISFELYQSGGSFYQ